MNTIELMDALKKANKLPSDYALAKHWQIDFSLVSKYRNGKVTFGDELAMRVADELGLERGQVLAWIAAERAEKQDQPEVAKAWQRLAKRAAAGLVAAIAVQIPVPPSSAIAAPSSSVAADGLCIMTNRRRRWLDVLAAVFGKLPVLAL